MDTKTLPGSIRLSNSDAEHQHSDVHLYCVEKKKLVKQEPKHVFKIKLDFFGISLEFWQTSSNSSQFHE